MPLLNSIEGGGGAIRYQIILDPIKIKYQIFDTQKNQISDITHPEKSNIRYQGTPPPSPIELHWQHGRARNMQVNFRRQGFRMIIFNCQAGRLQNFNRSHFMVIWRSVSFSDSARPPGRGVGRPKHPQNPPPPPEKKIVHAFQNPRNIFEKKI